jgi:tRNA(Arg) A34 adenosine deaminase TadA
VKSEIASLRSQCRKCGFSVNAYENINVTISLTCANSKDSENWIKQMFLTELQFQLPRWLVEHVGAGEIILKTDQEKMRFVIELSRLNIKHKTGGPFGAGVFDGQGKLIAPGMNLVESEQCSILHAEIVALALAQKILNRFDLGMGGKLKYELVSTTQPCAMCYGAIPWSGVSRLVCGARDEDAGSIGFDEGPKLKDWIGELEKRGIEVQRDILRNEAAAVLRQYADDGGTIYNAGKKN